MASIKSALGGVGSSGGVLLGGVTTFPAQSPPVITQYGATYLREGYFETVDYDALLEPIAEQTMGFNTGYDAGNGNPNIQNSADNDGGNYWIAFVSNNALLRSTDDGTTWTDITATVGISVAVNTKVKWISGTGATSVWLIQTGTGVQRSVDGGATWSSVATGIGSSDPCIVSNGNVVIITGNTGVFRRSTDGGATFGSSVNLNGSDRRVATGTYTKDNIFVLMGATSVGTTAVTAVWVSDDNGVTFGNALTAGLPSAALQGAVYAPKYNRVYYYHSGDLKVLTAFTKTAITVSTFSLASTGSQYSVAANKADGAFWIWQSTSGIIQYKEQADNSVPIVRVGAVAPWAGSLGFLFNNVQGTKFLVITSGAVVFVCKKAVGLYVSTPAGNSTTGFQTNVAPYMRVK